MSRNVTEMVQGGGIVRYKNYLDSSSKPLEKDDTICEHLISIDKDGMLQLEHMFALEERATMALNSAIEWTDATWNPVTGCTEVSPGCDHCYAKVFAERFRGVSGHHYEQGFDLKLWAERLKLPLQWKKPKRIFVNSMSDLFHKDVPTEFILQVFETMVQADWHIFQILTKRPSRLARLAPRITKYLSQFRTPAEPWPAHIWIGVSIETNQYGWRADQLRRVPVQVRFISAEPLLGPLDAINLTDIHWLITGGESGAGHRPCKTEWVRDLQRRCQEADIAFFFKQWGGRTPKAGGRELDGHTWDEFPPSFGR